MVVVEDVIEVTSLVVSVGEVEVEVVVVDAIDNSVVVVAVAVVTMVAAAVDKRVLENEVGSVVVSVVMVMVVWLC
jgi:hypothetical protein